MIAAVIFSTFFLTQNQCDAIEDNTDSGFDSFYMDEGPLFENEQIPKKTIKKKTAHWGFGIGITPTTIQISDASQSKVLKGNNFVIKFVYDRLIQKKINLMLGSSLLPLSASQPDTQLGTAKFEVSYLSFEVGGRISFTSNPLQGPWIGGGFHYLMTTSKPSSNVINLNANQNRSLPHLSAGYNNQMDDGFLTFQADWLLHAPTPISRGSINISQYVLTAIYFF